MKDATDVTIILDRSGSMEAIKTDTIGGFNTFVEEQKKISGECRLTLVQFDSQAAQEVVFDNVPVANVTPLTVETFKPRANTPLYDAVGQAIVRTGERLKAIGDNDRPDKIIFVIITDGYENASHEYSQKKVLEMIEHQTAAYKWQFVYLGANQDALKVGALIGIGAAWAMNYAPTPDGTNAVYTNLSANVAQARSGPRASMSASLGWTDEQRKKAAAQRKQG
jgi:Mg-chelatase subunit ChlD